MATATTKKVNYTAEQTAELKALFAAGKNVDELATKFGKSTRSIIAKLSREGVLKAKEYVSKAGEKPITKEAFVKQIAEKLGVEMDKLNGLEKTNKAALKLISESLNAF